MNSEKIRPIVICLFLNDGKILAAEYEDPLTGEIFYRPLGGEIKFGEISQEALVREIREEISVEIGNLRYLGMIENLFTFNGEQRHELVFVYDGKFLDDSFYVKEQIFGYDDWGSFRAFWKSLAYFKDIGSSPLYPEGIIKLLEEFNSRVTEKKVLKLEYSLFPFSWAHSLH